MKPANITKNLLPFLGCLSLVLLPGYLIAQLSIKTSPLSEKLNLTASEETLEIAPLDIEALRAMYEWVPESNEPFQFAEAVEVDYGLENSGRWIDLPNNMGRLWRMNISCAGAKNLSLFFEGFYLPRGATFHIYGVDSTQVLGGFTSRNNRANGTFSVTPLSTDRLTLEYFEPAAVAGMGTINIAKVARGFYDIDEAMAVAARSLPCQVNAACSPEGDGTALMQKSVAKLLINGIFLCTGTLLNNTTNDQTPYLLTANHCLKSGDHDAVTNSEINEIICYWNYRSASCEGEGLDVPIETTSGAIMRANSPEAGLSGTDFALLELLESPVGNYDVYFAGFDASEYVSASGVKGLHHPGGDILKVSHQPYAPTTYIGERYLRCNWVASANGYGTTEGGSSGSALFSDRGHVIGQLYGGQAGNCATESGGFSVYGRVAVSWQHSSDNPARQLRNWLSPGDGNETVADGMSVAFLVENCGTPYFSQYVEGMGMNRCLEIFNPTPDSIDFSENGYHVDIYFNGMNSPISQLPLSGIIAPYETYVICDNDASDALLSLAQETFIEPFFGGNDAVVLGRGGRALDVIGQVGYNPGQQWGSGALSTKDNVLHRKPNILVGDTIMTDVFDPAQEWIGAGLGNTSGLGSFDCECQVWTCPLDQLPTSFDCTMASVFIDFDEMGTLSGPAVYGHELALGELPTGTFTLKYVEGVDSCEMTFTKVDNTPPVVAALNSVINLESGSYVLSTADVWNEAASYDNCGGLAFMGMDVSTLDCSMIGELVPVTFVVSDDAGNETEATALISVEGDPNTTSLWSHQDIGNSNPPGDLLSGGGCGSSDVIEVLSNGCSSSNSFDQLHFVYQELCGDAEIITRIDEVHGAGYGGLEMRDNLQSNAKKVAIYNNHSHFSRYQYRTQPGEMATLKYVYAPNARYLRLIREGNTFRGYTSVNGSYWKYAFKQVITMSDCIYIGLAARSAQTSSQAEVTFSQVTIGPYVNTQNGNGLIDIPEVAVQTNALEVFPNPTVDYVQLTTERPLTSADELYLVDVFGREIPNIPAKRDAFRATLNLHGLASGTYLLVVQQGDARQIMPIIKQE